MKVVKDEDLSVLHSYTHPIAKQMAKKFANLIVTDIVHLLNNDDKFGDLDYGGTMTFINTLATNIFLQLFGFACHIGKQFPDVGHYSQDLFEEMIQSLRILTGYKEQDKKEYPIGEIKKINLKKEDN
jgi:hypothetical protein